MITKLDTHTALVLIDLQKGILETPTAHPKEIVLQNAARLVNAFHEAQLPVVLVNVEPSGPWLRTRKEAQGPGGDRPPDFSEIADELPAEQSDIRITKPGWNAFYNTALHDELQQRGVTNIVIGGVSTSIGVEGTARAASERGYNIAFVTDAMTDRNAGAHTNSIERIFPRMGELGSTEDVVQKLNARG